MAATSTTPRIKSLAEEAYFYGLQQVVFYGTRYRRRLPLHAAVLRPSLVADSRILRHAMGRPHGGVTADGRHP